MKAVGRYERAGCKQDLGTRLVRQQAPAAGAGLLAPRQDLPVLGSSRHC